MVGSSQDFWNLLRRNSNYRYVWLGQIVSEIGDHFNSIAVLSLALYISGSGLAVGGVMIARTITLFLAGPVAGVLLDRMDRRKVMLLSDVFRAVVASCFVATLTYRETWLLYVLSGLLMFASPFFTSGRMAILPKITTPEELHTANTLTQTTQWLTLTFGTMLGGMSTMQFGFEWAFVINALSFVFSAWAIWKLRSPSGHFLPEQRVAPVPSRRSYWHDYVVSLRYIASTPLVLAIGLSGVGWASGGGAAQILFTLYGEVVFRGGAAAVGLIWGFAGVGLVIGGIIAHRLGQRLDFSGYKHAITAAFVLHGGAYILFSQMRTIAGAIIFIALSRIGMGINNVLNRTMLLNHVPDALRGRVFTTVDVMRDAVMVLSLAAAGVASKHMEIRQIGLIAGCLSASTAVFWAAANFVGWIPEPPSEPAAEEEMSAGAPVA